MLESLAVPYLPYLPYLFPDLFRKTKKQGYTSKTLKKTNLIENTWQVGQVGQLSGIIELFE